MRKLIIIGNGFDKAHNTPTSYGDFMKCYLISFFIKFSQTDYMEYRDDFFSIKRKKGTSAYRYDDYLTPKRVLDLLSELRKTPSDYSEVFQFKSNSKFLDRIIKNVEELRWVDIENEYFNSLKDLRQNSKIEDLETLNNDFAKLKQHLLEYLAEQQYNEGADEVIVGKLIDGFDVDDIEKNWLCLLSFNYTNTVDKYKQACEVYSGLIKSVKCNYIHGSLDGENGQPVFGVGDEYDPEYELFKNTSNKHFKELLKNSKSQWYLRNENYRDLLNYIQGNRYNGIVEENFFDVEIYGHSCGSSDRTLLRYIFEHPNCQSIKVFYHEKEEHFFDLMLDLEKIFTDPILFRQKVLSLKSCEPMPQLPKKQEK